MTHFADHHLHAMRMMRTRRMHGQIAMMPGVENFRAGCHVTSPLIFDIDDLFLFFRIFPDLLLVSRASSVGLRTQSYTPPIT
jgi:hypothetical protein